MKINLFKIITEKSKNKSYKNEKIKSKNNIKFFDNLNFENLNFDIDDFASMNCQQRERYIFGFINKSICEGKEVEIKG